MISPSDYYAPPWKAKRYRGPRPTIPREKELDLFEQLREKKYDESTCWKEYQGFVREYVASVSDFPSESTFPSDRKAQQIKAKFVAFLGGIYEGASAADAFRIACDPHRKATKRQKTGRRGPPVARVTDGLPMEVLMSWMREAEPLAFVSAIDTLMPYTTNLISQLLYYVDMSSTIETSILGLQQNICNELAGGRKLKTQELQKGIPQIERYRFKTNSRYDWMPAMSKIIDFSQGEGGESHDTGEGSEDEFDGVQKDFSAAKDFLQVLTVIGENLNAITDASLPEILKLNLEGVSEISEVTIDLLMILIEACTTKSVRGRIFRETIQPFLIKCCNQNKPSKCWTKLVKVDWICSYFVDDVIVRGILLILPILKFDPMRMATLGHRVSDSLKVLTILSERRQTRRCVAANDGLTAILQVCSTHICAKTNSIRDDATKCLVALASDKDIGAQVVENQLWYSALVMLCRPFTHDDAILWINNKVVKLIWRLLQAKHHSCDRIVAKFVVPMMEGVIWGKHYNESVEILKLRVVTINSLCSRVVEQDLAALIELYKEKIAWQMQLARKRKSADSLDNYYEEAEKTENKLSSFIAFLSSMAKLDRSFRQKIASDGLLSLMISTFLPLDAKEVEANQMLSMIIEPSEEDESDLSGDDDNDDSNDSNLTRCYTPPLTLTNPSLSPNLVASNGISDYSQMFILGSVESNNSTCSVTSVASDGDDADGVESSPTNERAEEDGNRHDSLNSLFLHIAGDSTGHRDKRHEDDEQVNASDSFSRASSRGVKYWLTRFSGELVDVVRDGNCLLYASSIAAHDNSGTRALDETTLQNLKTEVYTVMMGNLLGDVEFNLLDPASELDRIKPGRQERGSPNDDIADLLSYYKMESKMSVNDERPQEYWGNGHFLRALAQVKKTPIYVIDELASGEAHVQRYMCKTYTYEDGTNHESACQESLSDHEAERVFRAYIKADVIPVMLVLRHSEQHFYAVSHGDLRKWCPEGMRERQREVHRELNSGWVDPSDQSHEARKIMVQQVEEELNRRRWM